MDACTFFGDSDCIGLRRYRLEEAITDLILNQGVDLFYVGNEGQFGALVHWVLFAMKKKYPHIHYAVVLAYPPKNLPGEDYSDTRLPDGIEKIDPDEAVAWRNRWILQQANYVVTYIPRSGDEAAMFVEEAMKEGKRMIRLV